MKKILCLKLSLLATLITHLTIFPMEWEDIEGEDPFFTGAPEIEQMYLEEQEKNVYFSKEKTLPKETSSMEMIPGKEKETEKKKEEVRESIKTINDVETKLADILANIRQEIETEAKNETNTLEEKLSTLNAEYQSLISEEHKTDLETRVETLRAEIQSLKTPQPTEEEEAPETMPVREETIREVLTQITEGITLPEEQEPSLEQESTKKEITEKEKALAELKDNYDEAVQEARKSFLASKKQYERQKQLLSAIQAEQEISKVKRQGQQIKSLKAEIIYAYEGKVVEKRRLLKPMITEKWRNLEELENTEGIKRQVNLLTKQFHTLQGISDEDKVTKIAFDLTLKFNKLKNLIDNNNLEERIRNAFVKMQILTTRKRVYSEALSRAQEEGFFISPKTKNSILKKMNLAEAKSQHKTMESTIETLNSASLSYSIELNGPEEENNLSAYLENKLSDDQKEKLENLSATSNLNDLLERTNKFIVEKTQRQAEIENTISEDGLKVELVTAVDKSKRWLRRKKVADAVNIVYDDLQDISDEITEIIDKSNESISQINDNANKITIPEEEEEEEETEQEEIVEAEIITIEEAGQEEPSSKEAILKAKAKERIKKFEELILSLRQKNNQIKQISKNTLRQLWSETDPKKVKPKKTLTWLENINEILQRKAITEDDKALVGKELYKLTKNLTTDFTLFENAPTNEDKLQILEAFLTGVISWLKTQTKKHQEYFDESKETIFVLPKDKRNWFEKLDKRITKTGKILATYSRTIGEMHVILQNVTTPNKINTLMQDLEENKRNLTKLHESTEKALLEDFTGGILVRKGQTIKEKEAYKEATTEISSQLSSSDGLAAEAGAIMNNMSPGEEKAADLTFGTTTKEGLNFLERLQGIKVELREKIEVLKNASKTLTGQKKLPKSAQKIVAKTEKLIGKIEHYMKPQAQEIEEEAINKLLEGLPPVETEPEL